jgi:hypothetical protein
MREFPLRNVVGKPWFWKGLDLETPLRVMRSFDPSSSIRSADFSPGRTTLTLTFHFVEKEAPGNSFSPKIVRRKACVGKNNL